MRSCCVVVVHLLGLLGCTPREESPESDSPTHAELLAVCEASAECSLEECEDELVALYAHQANEPSDEADWPEWEQKDNELGDLLDACYASCVAPEPLIGSYCVDDPETIDTLSCAASVGLIGELDRCDLYWGE